MRVITASRTVATLAAFALASGCSDSNPVEPDPNLIPTGGITISPTNATIGPGETVELSAHRYTTSGDELANSPVIWSSSNEQVASVSSNGLVFGRAEGHAVISAWAAGNAQVVTVHVLRRERSIVPRPNMDPWRLQ